MPTNAAILTLTQWFSPAYPVGAFSYSHGLESAVDAGQVSTAAEAQSWIADVLEFGAGRSDAILLAAAFRAIDANVVAQIDATARAFAPSSERLIETERQGAAFCKVTHAVWGTEAIPLTYPVAVGRAARLRDLPQTLCAAMFLHAFAANLMAAAQRLCKVGQTEAQAAIDALAPLCNAIAKDTAHGDLDQLSGVSFMADIASMNHETQYSRMFQT